MNESQSANDGTCMYFMHVPLYVTFICTFMYLYVIGEFKV